MNHIFIEKNDFIRILLFFKIYSDFESDNEIDNSSIGNKTTTIFEQHPVLNAYHIISELEDV